jgi:hypothetical protein
MDSGRQSPHCLPWHRYPILQQQGLIMDSWNWEIIFDVHEIVYCQFDKSSIAIDWLYNLGHAPIYIYFQRDYSKQQTPRNVIKALLQQVLLSDIGPSPNESLIAKYEKFQSDAADRNPNYEDFLVSVCKKFSKLLGTRLIVLFDALDECCSSYQDEILQLIDIMSKSEIPVYVTTRDHLEKTVKFNLPTNTKALCIYARDADIGNYLAKKFEKVRVGFEDGVKEAIIKRITEGSKGM